MKVAGHNYFCILCAESNNKSITNLPAISPPVNSRLDVNSLLSYSVYDDHAVWVMRDGRAFAIGNGTNGKICGKLPQSLLQKQTEISITDSNGDQCIFLSAVCGTWYTLYLLQTQDGPDHLKLAYSCYSKDVDTPIFLNTRKLNPVALYGGSLTAAAIDQDGIVILITEAIFKSPTSQPPTVILPNNEKAVSVGCLEQSFFILSENGVVYKCTLSETDYKPELKVVEELSEMKIIHLSATAAHCLAVTTDGRVFGHGLNDNGRIGVSTPFSKIFTFQQITELKSKKILDAYAGCNHSLFMTENGAVYACGSNYNGELFFESGPTEKDVLTPQLTMIKQDATFCVTGIFLSAIFIGIEPPPNMPNLRNDRDYPEFADPNADVVLPSDFTAMDTSEVDRMVLRPISAFDELRQLESEPISSSPSTFEPKERSPVQQILNRNVLDINDMHSGSSTKKVSDKGKRDSEGPSKRSSSKGEQNPMASILGIGDKLINNENSGQGSSKPQNQSSTTPKKTSSAARREESEKSRASTKSQDKAAILSSSHSKSNQQPASTKRSLGSEKINNLSSASMDDKPAERSSKAENQSNSMAHSISSEKINDISKSDGKPNSRNQSSTHKGMESSAKSKQSRAEEERNSAAPQDRSISSEKNKSSSKGDKNPMSPILGIGDQLLNNEKSQNQSSATPKKTSSAAKREESEKMKSHESTKSKASTKSQEKNLSSQKPTEKDLSSQHSKKTTEKDLSSQHSQKTNDKNLSSQHSQKPTEKDLSSQHSQKSNAKNSTPSSPKRTTQTKTKSVKEPSSDEKPFFFESNQASRISTGSKLSINSELAHLRQQNSEMKELLASKDKEILRLTKLNETFVGNNNELQSNLIECWDNQKHKIDKLDTLNNSKRRKK